MVRRLSCRANIALASPYPYSASYLRVAPQCLSHLRLSAARTFSNNAPRFSEKETHYDVLGVSHTATPAEIKKSFYSLSRETHPDINPNDPTASARFASVSESYHILSDPDKRKRYDRDVIHVHQRHHHGHHGSHSHRGSYAGSRPASGLSKRRSTFHGPPPSFYAQGGYGKNSHRHKAGPHPGSRPNVANRQRQNESATGPRPFTDQPLTQDFNSDSVRRTQAAEDSRRLSRRQAALASAQKEMAHSHDFWVRVIVVLGIFVGAATVGGMVTAKKKVDRPSTDTRKGLLEV